jgi:hypothetical protein
MLLFASLANTLAAGQWRNENRGASRQFRSALRRDPGRVVWTPELYGAGIGADRAGN